MLSSSCLVRVLVFFRHTDSDCPPTSLARVSRTSSHALCLPGPRCCIRYSSRRGVSLRCGRFGRGGNCMPSLRAVEQSDLTAGSEALRKGMGTALTRASPTRHGEIWVGSGGRHGVCAGQRAFPAPYPVVGAGGSAYGRIAHRCRSESMERCSLPGWVVLVGADGRNGYPQVLRPESGWEVVSALLPSSRIVGARVELTGRSGLTGWSREHRGVDRGVHGRAPRAV